MKGRHLQHALHYIDSAPSTNIHQASVTCQHEYSTNLMCSYTHMSCFSNIYV